MYACTGALPSALAMRGLPPARSFTGWVIFDAALALAAAPATFAAVATGLRAPLPRDVRLALGFNLLSVIIRPSLLYASLLPRSHNPARYGGSRSSFRPCRAAASRS